MKTLTTFLHRLFLCGIVLILQVPTVHSFLHAQTPASPSSVGLDAIEAQLRSAAETRVQEKVFVHTDNRCYFLGDTLWYKAYVVRADNLMPTDMSRMLYVELLSPDGLVVERQTVVVSNKGYGCGQFVLTDSLFSGYYELRAYTRWMLNFNVKTKRYRRDDAHLFYNNEMAADFFRYWDGLYSRVLPVYEKPEQAGDYSVKYIINRPKERVAPTPPPTLHAHFFPEGGHLVEGVNNRVAFELTDEQGQAVELKGTLACGTNAPKAIEAGYMGRGAFELTPTGERSKALFTWQGKHYEFPLPKAEAQGVAMLLKDRQILLHSRGIDTTQPYGLSILCRGVLRHYQTVRFAADGTLTLTLPASLPLGVNDVTLFNAEGVPLADRLFFVSEGEQRSAPVTLLQPLQDTYAPYSQVNLSLHVDGVDEPQQLSLSIRDKATDEPSYDTGNILTDLLLSSELKGFVAYPDYYFALDSDDVTLDKQRTAALDLLMMVQGWRRYDWRQLMATDTLRYQPETTLTLEGRVYKTVDINPVEPDEIDQWQYGMGYSGDDTTQLIDTSAANANGLALTRIPNANSTAGVNHRPMKREVMIEAEIAVGGQFAGSVQKTHDGGRFLFQLPPFYGTAILNMKAYKENDSIKKNMLSRKDKHILDETEWPDFYVKRDLFFPVFPSPYNYYQSHAPEQVYQLSVDSLSELSMENDIHRLKNIDVKGKLHGRKRINMEKPVFTIDAYDLYNLVTDYGLSYGYFDMRQFPIQAARVLYGNMGREVSFNVDAYIDSTIFYRSYVPEENMVRTFLNNKNHRSFHETFHLKRLSELRFFTDFNPREEDTYLEPSVYRADVTIDFVPFADDAVQPSFRDRHGYIDGISLPLTFYQPNYQGRMQEAPADYRRTLYWNPNLTTDADGNCKVSFYNNGRSSHLGISVAGITTDGRMMYEEKKTNN